MDTVFDSADLPVPDRVEAWQETTAQALMTTRFRILEPAAFGARLRALSAGPAQVSAMSYGPMLSQRTPQLIRRSDPEQYQLALIRSGCQGIDQARTTARLGPGDMVFYDSSRPYDAYVEGGPSSRSESVLLQFPRQLLPLPEAKVARLLAVPLRGADGVAALLTQFVTAMVDGDVRYTPMDTARLGNVALDLVTATLAHHLDSDSARPERSPHDVEFLRATSFIHQQLRVPDLTPAMVAAALQVSVRQLHRVFRQHGTSVSAYVREQRLDRCRRDLADPHLQHLTVGSVARRWGFVRPSDFTRAFRAAMGMTPTEYRAAVRSGAASPVRVRPPG